MNNKQWVWEKIGNITDTFKRSIDYLKLTVILIAAVISIISIFISSIDLPHRYYYQGLVVFLTLLSQVINFQLSSVTSQNLEVYAKFKESEDNYECEKNRNGIMASFLTTMAYTIDDINQLIHRTTLAASSKKIEKSIIANEVKNRIKVICNTLHDNSDLFYINMDEREEKRFKISIYIFDKVKKNLKPIYIASEVKSSYRHWSIEENKEESFIVEGYLSKDHLIIPDWQVSQKGSMKKNKSYDEKTYRSVIVSPICPKPTETQNLNNQQTIGVIAISSSQVDLWDKTDENLSAILELCVQVIWNLWYNTIIRYEIEISESTFQEIAE